jgi:hypothetical protein
MRTKIKMFIGFKIYKVMDYYYYNKLTTQPIMCFKQIFFIEGVRKTKCLTVRNRF